MNTFTLRRFISLTLLSAATLALIGSLGTRAATAAEPPAAGDTAASAAPASTQPDARALRRLDCASPRGMATAAGGNDLVNFGRDSTLGAGETADIGRVHVRLLDQRRRGRRRRLDLSAIRGSPDGCATVPSPFSATPSSTARSTATRSRCWAIWNSDRMRISAATPWPSAAACGATLPPRPWRRPEHHWRRYRQFQLAARLGPSLPAVWAAAGLRARAGLGMGAGARLSRPLCGPCAAVSGGPFSVHTHVRDPTGSHRPRGA